VLRACASIRGSMGCSAGIPKNLPVNIARPMAADNPQQKVAAAMKK
jgi:hypothetical protein